MSKTILGSALKLRSPITQPSSLPLLPVRIASRTFNTTAQIVEPAPPQPDEAISHGAHKTSTRRPPSHSSISSIPTPPQPAGLRPGSETLPPTRRGIPSSRPTPVSESVRTLLPHLAAQPAHYIRVHIHGFPYLVTAGDQVRLPFHMPGVMPGDVLRLNRASVLGSRDYTLQGGQAAEAAEPPYIDERLFECRAVVLGTESEPMRLKIKKKQRCRRAKTVKSKHQYTVLRISEVKVNSLEEIET